jgi:S1-C subfamily serine protease
MVLVVIIVVSSLLAGGLLGYFVGYSATSEKIDNLQGQITALQEQISTIPTTSEETGSDSQLNEQIENLQNQLSTLQQQINDLQATPTITYQNITYILDEIDDLKDRLSTLQQQINNLQTTPTVIYQNITYILYENFSLSQLFDQVRESVVVVQAIITQYDLFGRPYYTQVQGSGFVYSINGQLVILTSYHVIEGGTDINVTFITGNGYAASVLGSDQYKDIAVLSTDAPQNEYSPLAIISSSTLRVGDPVIAVGTPYGLAGSMSNGIVSALNRTLVADEYSITNIIQTTAPINPGNSGGPLLNYQGQVVGIITAIIEDSQGIGFAIPSDTILEGIEDIIAG